MMRIEKLRSPSLAAWLVLVGVLATPSLLQAQQRGATATTGGQGGGTNQSAGGQVDTAAGTSAQIERDFGDGLVGRSDTADRFVGNQAASTNGARTQAPTNFQQLNRQRTQQNTPTGSPLRARLVLGFDAQALRTNSRSAITQPTFARTAIRGVSPNVDVAISSAGLATLSGSVQTPRDSRLAEAIVRLEPGVSKVENRIVVVDAVPPLPGQ